MLRGVLITPSLLIGAFVAWAFLGGVRVTATLVSDLDATDHCIVRWVDPRDAQVRENNILCGGPATEAGDELDLIAYGPPWSGEVIDVFDLWYLLAWAGVLALPCLLLMAVQRSTGSGESAAVDGQGAARD